MLKKTITYENLFTGEEVTEDHYFHVSKADLIEMQMLKNGKMEEYLQRIIKSEDGQAILTEFKKLIEISYGRKDGDRFIKTQDAWIEFYSSEAYSQLFTELCTNAEAAAEFINGIVPRGLAEEAAQISADIQKLPESSPKEDPTGLITENTPRVLTQAEMLDMDAAELKSGLAEGHYKLS